MTLYIITPSSSLLSDVVVARSSPDTQDRAGIGTLDADVGRLLGNLGFVFLCDLSLEAFFCRLADPDGILLATASSAPPLTEQMDEIDGDRVGLLAQNLEKVKNLNGH